jgi:3-oxoacyl-[acyl-carrier-protein] synthase-3
LKKIFKYNEYNYSRNNRCWSLCSDFVLSNKVLETMVDTNDEWITSRTGIKERRILKDADKGTSFLAIKAAQDLSKTNVDP